MLCNIVVKYKMNKGLEGFEGEAAHNSNPQFVIELFRLTEICVYITLCNYYVLVIR